MEFLKKYKWFVLIAILLLLGHALSLKQDRFELSKSDVFTQHAASVLGNTPITEDASTAPRDSEIAPTTFEYESAGKTAAEVDQKVIKTGNLEMHVRSVDQTMERITALVLENGGFVQHASANQYSDQVRYGSISVRVPAKEFEQTYTSIKATAELVTNESIDGQDVTEQFTDLEARLRNAVSQEQTYLALLNQAKNIEDILAIQRELGSIRAQIESLQGRLQYIENQTSLSTIHVSLTQETGISLPTQTFRPWQTVKDSTQALIFLVQHTLEQLITFVIIGGGILIPAGLIIWFGVWLIRRKRRK